MAYYQNLIYYFDQQIGPALILISSDFLVSGYFSYCTAMNYLDRTKKELKQEKTCV